MFLRRKRSGRLNGRMQSRSVFNGTLVILLSLCILLGLFGWKNAVAEEYSCGLEEHTHNSECYEDTLICTNEDEDHEHDESSYEKTLICDKTEHTHTEECLVSDEQKENFENQNEGTAENAIMALAAEEDSVPSAQADVPSTFTGTTPPNTVINLFDYWTTNSKSPENQETWTNYFDGINQRESNNLSDTDYSERYDRPLVFRRGCENDDFGLANRWTGDTDPIPRQGIVQNKLGEDGYPLINWKKSGYWLSDFTSNQTLMTDNASLDYLFDSSNVNNSNNQTMGKLVYSNVDGLFQVDDQGYYYYDCTKNYAYYNKTDNSFELYNGTPSIPQFFPFASFETANKVDNVNIWNSDPSLNHYFGLTMTTRFVQDYKGHVSAGSNANEMIFDFSGDDDVWIFVDDVLVSDVGGIHNKVGTSINFATGEVKYYDAGGTEFTDLESSLAEQFNKVYGDNAVASMSGWTKINADTNDETYVFADGTSHTLKFFYMERGNNESNMKLKTNLLQIPETSISKVDQYGNSISGVGLAAYTAALTNNNGTTTNQTDSSQYRYVVDPLPGETEKVLVEPSTITSSMVNSSTGIITLSNGRTIKPKLTGITNEDGEWVLVNNTGAPYTTTDLKENVFESSEIIVREIAVPDGYRTVSDNIFLYFDQGEHLTTPNAYESGVWPSPNVLVTASNTLYPTNWSSTDDNIDYYTYDSTDQQWKTKGTLFAVVLKRNGASLQEFEDTWYPIYGNETSGYTVLDTPGLSSVLKAYQTNVKEKYSDPTFSQTATGMQVLLTDLPGSLSRYYTYMLEHKIQTTDMDPQYAVAYFYSELDKDTLLTLDPSQAASNIVRVASHSGVSYAPESYTGFITNWSATIEITNIEDRLYYQKYDEQGNPVNGATFALYNVEEDNGKVYFPSDDGQYEVFLADDEDLDNKGTAIVKEANSTDATSEITGTYQINTTSGNDISLGVITVTAEGIGNITISPAISAETDENGQLKNCVGMTKESAIQGANTGDSGTGYFTKLLDGKYILREIAAPEGYKLNTSLIKVLVNENGVYANAGTTDDGVIVGNGAGFLIPTFSDCASHSDIDETLTWIYSLLRVNEKDNSYDALNSLNVLYAPESGKISDDEIEDGWLYANTEDASDGLSTSVPTASRPDAMVTYLEYGDEVDDTTTHKIFDYIVNTVMKTIDDEEVNIAQLARNASTNAYPTTKGQGTLRLYTDVGWSELSILQDYEWGSTHRSVVGDNDSNSTTYTNLTNQNVYGQTGVNMNLAHLFSNSTFVRVTDPRPIDVQLTKVDPTKEDSQKYLTGAEFILYQEIGLDGDGNSINQYYNYDSTNGTSWVSNLKDATTIKFDENSQNDTAEDDTSQDDTTQTVHGLISGTYYLKETKAPSGYVIETQPWKMVLTETELSDEEPKAAEGAVGKAIVELYNPDATVASQTATIYIFSTEAGLTYSQLDAEAQPLVLELENTQIYNLPSSGSFGVLPFILAGSLILGFSVYLLIREERQTEA